MRRQHPLQHYGFKVLALMLPCIVIILIWTIAIAPLSSVFDGFRVQANLLRQVISAERRDISEGPELQAALSDLQNHETQLGGVRQEASQALAAAGLQDDVQDIVGRLGGQVLTIEPLPATEQDDFEVISMRVSITIPNNSLGRLLREIETHRPFMFIQSASFQSDGAMSYPAPTDTSGPIMLTFVITAYRRS